MAEATKAELQAQLADTTKRAAIAEKRVEELTNDLTAANARADEEAKARGAAEAKVYELSQELRAATGSLKAYRGSATKLRNEITVLRKEKSPEVRSIGAMKGAKNEDEAAASGAALEAAFALDTTELVFSDGRREIRELAPLTIGGDAWRQTPQGRVLNHEPLLEPGEFNRQEIVLRGFGLLNEAGEQVAYHALYEPVTIRPNERVQLPHNSVRF